MEPAPSNLTLDDQLCFALYAATNAVVRAYRPLLAQIGLTYPQYLLMLVLWQDGERAVHELADRLALPPHAMSPILDRLQAAGLLTRRRTAPDRRVVHVQLTPAGRELRTAAARVQEAVACATRLAPDALAALRSELHALAEGMAEPEPAVVAARACGSAAHPNGRRRSAVGAGPTPFPEGDLS